MHMVSICGVPITILDPHVARETFLSWLDGTRFSWVVTANPEILLRAYKDPTYRALVKQADHVTPDGSGVILVANLLGYGCSFKQRVTGVDLAKLLLAGATDRSQTVLVVLPDDSLSMPEELNVILTKRYPKANILVRRDAVLSSLTTHERETVSVIFAAHGAPRQEQWIREHKARFPNAKVAVGVGGTFDFMSGTLHRAPQWMRTAGLEWLFRVLIEPSRLARITRAVIVFPIIAVTHRHYE